jgi:seryl-tRNA synthetase
MLDVRFICENIDRVRKNAEAKGENRAEPEKVAELYEKKKKLQFEVDEARRKINEISKAIGAAKRQDPKSDIGKQQEESRLVGEGIKSTEEAMKALDREVDDLRQWIPNLADEDVPVGEEETANRVVRTWGRPKTFDFEPKPHWELGKELGILDEERSAKLTASNFLLLKGPGARLERSLINFMLDLHTGEHGYTEIWPPHLSNRDSMFGTVQIPKLEDDMYRLRDDELWLIPTAEVPLTNLHRKEILSHAELPLRYAGFSACYRREAGAYSKETRGMQRIHQFDKVELVKFTHPDKSRDELESLTANAEKVLQLLGLPYRVVLLSTKGMSFASAKTYDLEVWAPGVGRWLEVSSCSNFTDFQARRLGARFRDADKKVKFLHTLNGSGLALPRTVIALLENGQQADGSVILPEPLHGTMGGLGVMRK